MLAAPAFEETAAAIMRQHGAAVAIHLRGQGTPVRRLFQLAATLSRAAGESGAALLVNGRADVALALPGVGLQVGAGAVPVAPSRRLLGDERLIGSSAHGVEEVVVSLASGADFVLLGTIWETATHPGRPGAGLDRVREVRMKVAEPVIGIGGVTPERARSLVEAGAYGAAAIRGIWGADDPVEAAAEYLERMEAARDE